MAEDGPRDRLRMEQGEKISRWIMRVDLPFAHDSILRRFFIRRILQYPCSSQTLSWTGVHPAISHAILNRDRYIEITC